MEVKISKTTTETVKLDENQVRSIVRRKLLSMLGGDGIEDRHGRRQVYTWEDTGHGSGLTTYLRDASELDEAIVRVLEQLR